MMRFYNDCKKYYKIISLGIIAGSGIVLFLFLHNRYAEPIVVFYEDITFAQGDTCNINSYSYDTYVAIMNGTAQSEPRPINEIHFTQFINFKQSTFDSISFASISPPGRVTGMQPVPIDTSQVGNGFTHTVYASRGNTRGSYTFTYSVRAAEP